MNATMRLCLLVSILLALGAAGYFLLGSEPESHSGGVATQTRETAKPTSEDASLAPTPVASDAAKIETETFVPAEERALQTALWSIAAVDEAGRPVEGAEITIRPDSSRPGEADFFIPRLNRTRAEKAPIAEGRTRAGGILPMVSLPPSGLEITARSGPRSALAVVPMPTQGTRVEIRLLPPREVMVTVVDQADQPLPGIKVAPIASSMRTQNKVFAWTDAQGVARMAIEGEYTDIHEAKEFRFAVHRPDGDQVPGPAVPWAAAGVTEARMVLEGARAVIVHVTDDRGQPVTGELRIACRRPPPESSDLIIIEMGSPEERERIFQGPRVVVGGFDEPGPIEFTLRETGRLDVKVTHELPDQPVVSTLDLRQGGLAPILAFTLVDHAGRPAAKQRFQVELEYEPLPSVSTEPRGGDLPMAAMRRRIAGMSEDTDSRIIQTDAQGRIEILAKADRKFELRLNWPREDLNEGPFYVFGAPRSSNAWFQRDIPPLAIAQRLDLDPIEVPELPLIAKGIVVDGDDKPLAGAEVRVIDGAPDTADPDPARGFERMARSAERRLVTRTGPDGRFEVRGANAPEVPALVASLGRAKAAPVVVRMGAEDVRIVIVPPGSIAGRGVLTVKGPFSLQVRADAQSGAPSEPENPFAFQFPNNATKDGQFTIPDLMPGAYIVTLSVEDHELLRVPDVIVRSGEVTRDPRLDGVTLGQDLEVARVTVQDPRGAPVAGANVEASFRAGGASRRGDRGMLTDEKGQTEILRHVSESIDVRVNAEGYLPYEREQVPFPLVVTLSEGAKLYATVVGLKELAAEEADHPGFSLSIRKKSEAVEAASEEVVEVRGSAAIAFTAAPSVSSARRFRPGTPQGQIKPGEESATIGGIAPETYEVLIERSQAPRVFRGGSGNAVIAFGQFGSTSLGNSKPIVLGTITVPVGATELRERYTLTQEAKAKLKKPESNGNR